MRKTIAVGTALILVQIPLLASLLVQQKTWGGVDRDGANGVAVAADGSVYVTGSTRSFGAGDDDAFLLKYAPDGTLAWQRTYGTAADTNNSGQEAGIGVAVAPDQSGAVVLGNYRDGNIFLAKFNPAGTLLWQRTWGGNPAQEGAGAIAIDPNGTIYVTGFTTGFNAIQGDVFLLSFTAAGSLNWQRTWGGGGFDVAHGIAVASDGNIFISGDTQFTANSAFLVKFAADGYVVWQREWGLLSKTGVAGETEGRGLAATPDGGAFAVGWSTGAGADPNLLAARFDSGGNFVWQRVGGPGFGSAQAVAVGTSGDLHVTGSALADGHSTGGAFVWTLTAAGKAQDAALWNGSDQFENAGGAAIAAAPDGTAVVVGAVGAGPYTFSRASKNARVANTFIAPIAGTVTTPGGIVGSPTVVAQTPAGSETFAGATDAFLLRIQP